MATCIWSGELIATHFDELLTVTIFVTFFLVFGCGNLGFTEGMGFEQNSVDMEEGTLEIGMGKFYTMFRNVWYIYYVFKLARRDSKLHGTTERWCFDLFMLRIRQFLKEQTENSGTWWSIRN